MSSKMIASGGNEAIGNNPVGGASVEVVVEPSEACLEALFQARPDTPFHMPGFVRAETAAGKVPVAFLAVVEGVVLDGCIGLIQSGIHHRRLKVHSSPALPADHQIWPTMWRFCARLGIDSLRLESYASLPLRIPGLQRETSRRARVEYVLGLDDWDPAERLSTNHRRNVARARKVGIEIVETTDPSAIPSHEQLIGLSFERRRERGEAIVMAGSSYSRTLLQNILACEVGSLFQARLDGQVLSSVLVLKAPSSAYYYSAGTSPQGMHEGASQLLICAIAERLRDAGKSTFNLAGAAADQPGLVRFKLGFGATASTSEAAAFAPAKGILPHLLGGFRLRQMRPLQGCGYRGGSLGGPRV